jgi:hypothetical protein
MADHSDHSGLPDGGQLTWSSTPEDHDYPAAVSFLSLIVEPETAQHLAELLRSAPTVQYHAKDVLRAARLALLPANDAEVAKDLHKVDKGTALSPILLVRGDIGSDRPLHVADGYHRLCASYHLSENTEIPCRIVCLPAS